MERRRVLASLGVATVGVLAGCGDTLDGEDAPEHPFPDADWRDGDGLAVETLATRHADAAVAAGGVTLRSTARTDHDGETEPSPWLPSQTYESSYDLDEDRQYRRQELTESEETERTELYVTEGEALFREQFGSEVTYDRQALDREPDAIEETMRADATVGIRVPQDSAGDDVVYEGLSNWEPTFDGTAELEGALSARFVSDAFEGTRTVPRTVETAAAAVSVFESGFVPRIEQSWTGSHDGTTATVDVDIEYRDRGVPVSEPDWATEAREETADEP